MFTFELADDSRTAGRLAGIAPQVGLPHPGFTLKPSVPMSMIGMWGTSDTTVPPLSNTDDPDMSLSSASGGGTAWYYTTARNVSDAWGEKNGCSVDRVTATEWNDYDSKLDCTTFESCDDGIDVVECIFDGGHVCTRSYQTGPMLAFMLTHPRVSNTTITDDATDAPSSTPAPSNAPTTECISTDCRGKTCDEWVKSEGSGGGNYDYGYNYGYNYDYGYGYDYGYDYGDSGDLDGHSSLCVDLEAEWGCDCTGCVCAGDTSAPTPVAELPTSTPTSKPTPTPTDEPTTTACSDDSTWFYKGKSSRGCEWVGKKPHKYCGKKDSNDWLALDACQESCGTCDCKDSDTWRYKGKSSKGCDYVAKKPSKYCDSEDDDGTTAAEGCSLTCGNCGCQDSLTWRYKGKSSKDCDWVSKKPGKYCSKKSEGGAKAREACRVSCEAC